MKDTYTLKDFFGVTPVRLEQQDGETVERGTPSTQALAGGDPSSKKEVKHPPLPRGDPPRGRWGAFPHIERLNPCVYRNLRGI